MSPASSYSPRETPTNPLYIVVRKSRHFSYLLNVDISYALTDHDNCLWCVLLMLAHGLQSLQSTGKSVDVRCAD